MELVGERYRPGLGTAIQIAFSVGYMLQPVIAYRLRDEFWYQVAATSPNLIFPFVVMYVHITFLRLLLSLFCNMHVGVLPVCIVWFAVIRELCGPWPSPLNVLLVFGVVAEVLRQAPMELRQYQKMASRTLYCGWYCVFVIQSFWMS